ncbi:hypothetical protein C4572_01625 [Candidatus Parcubacteria bacterium]|nr:MAG: hypothetical protein C4572_01625 [Candidatus Parcubacteria bacterium]
MDAVKDLKVFIFIMVILAFVWLFTGGPLRPESKSGIFLDEPQEKHEEKGKNQIDPLFDGQTVETNRQPDAVTSSRAGSAASGTGKKSDSSSSSSPLPYFKGNDGSSIRHSSSLNQASAIKTAIAEGSTTNRVYLKTTRAKDADPKKEYIELRAEKKNTESVRITNWKIKGRNGLDMTVGKGAIYYYADLTSQPQEDIFLKPGERAIIMTGASPLGTNFKINKCLGYLSQFHSFNPKISVKCPSLRDKEIPPNLRNDDQCLDYIEDSRSCQTVLSIPSKEKLSSSCQEFIIENSNYKNCAETYKSDSDFYYPEWRIYLGRSEELWKKKRETITLTDENNNIVDSISY